MSETTKFVLFSLIGLFGAAYLFFLFWLLAKLISIVVKDKIDKDTEV